MLLNETTNLPDQGAISYQLWRLLYQRHIDNKGVLQTQEAYKQLEQIFDLTDEQKNVMNNSDNLSNWETRVRSAKNSLLNSGILKVLDNGEYLITEEGIKKYEELHLSR